MEKYLTQPFHHAYIVEGHSEDVISLTTILKEINSDAVITHFSYPYFSIENAREIKSISNEAFDTRYIIISVGSIGIEASQALLKLFEEPVKNLHIFLVVPDIGSIIPTLLSRVFVVPKSNKKENKDVIDFLKMDYSTRIEWMKKMIDSFEDGKDLRVFMRKFLFDLVEVLQKKNYDSNIIKNVFDMAQYIGDRGSSPKMILEYVALEVSRK